MSIRKTLKAVYRAAQYLLPGSFRREYGEEMTQAFDDGIEEAALRGDISRSLWRFAADLWVSAARERWAATEPASAALWLLAVPFGFAINYVDANNSEVQAAVLLILIFSFVFSLFVPRKAWRWALAIGIAVPFRAIGSAALGHPIPGIEPNAFATLIAFIPATIGAYCGALVRWFGTEVAR